MAIAVKLLASTLGVVGGGGIASVALWQSGYIRTNSTEGSSATDSSNSTGFWQTRPDTPETAEIVPKDNCTILDKAEWEEIIRGLKKANENYVVMSCENTGKQLKNWTGFLPNSAFNYELTSDEKLTITTETQDADEMEDEEDFDERYKTTFLGSKFANGGTIVGKWGTETENISGKKLTVVKDMETNSEYEQFYLLFESQ